jgi:hypothetical protein
VVTDLDTPRITGTSPGSRIQYETPLNVVPTSNASTSFRAEPLYGCRGSMDDSSNLKLVARFVVEDYICQREYFGFRS